MESYVFDAPYSFAQFLKGNAGQLTNPLFHTYCGFIDTLVSMHCRCSRKELAANIIQMTKDFVNLPQEDKAAIYGILGAQSIKINLKGTELVSF